MNSLIYWWIKSTEIDSNLLSEYFTTVNPVQWNPINMATNRPYEFGCINGGGSNFMAGLFQVAIICHMAII